MHPFFESQVDKKHDDFLAKLANFKSGTVGFSMKYFWKMEYYS